MHTYRKRAHPGWNGAHDGIRLLSEGIRSSLIKSSSAALIQHDHRRFDQRGSVSLARSLDAAVRGHLLRVMLARLVRRRTTRLPTRQLPMRRSRTAAQGNSPASSALIVFPSSSVLFSGVLALSSRNMT